MTIDENAYEATIENGVAVVSEVDPREVSLSLEEGITRGIDPRVHRALAQWAEGTRERSRSQKLFNRDRYVTPGTIFGQFAMAYDAADDDVVGNVLDTSESLAFQKVRFESEDEDQEDIWNQIGKTLNLDAFLRQAHRELLLCSQFYGVRWWGSKVYKLRGKGEGGRERRKEYQVFAPVRLGFLDPLRVVPVNLDVFGDAQLAWISTEEELSVYEDVTKGNQYDAMVNNLFDGKPNISQREREMLQREHIPVDKLVLLNPQYVFRHTLTRSTYERWAKVRMKSVFPLLDLKNQLREMDRAWLLGGVNFVVLVTRGTDDRPANQSEVTATANQVRAQSKSPIIVSDHRISIEIITPEIEHVLNPEKWDVLDERLMMRMWGTLNLPSNASSRETSETLGRVVSAALASRRHMLKRMIEAELITMIQDMNPELSAKAKLEYAPRRVELGFNSDLITLIQELRNRGDLSRQTVLEEFGFDQDMEAERREREEKLEEVFTPVNVPFDSPDKTTPGGSGPQSKGNPAGKNQTKSSNGGTKK